MAGEHEVDGRWASSDEGQRFSVWAITREGRVVARATATICLPTMEDMEDALGSAGRLAVERSVRAACERLAKAFPT